VYKYIILLYLFNDVFLYYARSLQFGRMLVGVREDNKNNNNNNNSLRLQPRANDRWANVRVVLF